MKRKPARRALLRRGERMRILFPYDRLLIGSMRYVPGSRFVKENKCWNAPCTVMGIETLLRNHFKLGEKLKAWYEGRVKPEEIELKDVSNFRMPNLGGKAYGFQKRGVKFLESRNGRGLLADEMGLGKTIQALAYLKLHPESCPALIIVPATVKIKWKREIKKWMKTKRVTILNGKTPYPFDANIVIINYDIITDWLPELKAIKPEVVIMDEVHWIKNPKAIRTKTMKKICRGVPHVIGLSGTPIVNRPYEFLTTLQIIAPKAFPSWWQFVQRYCGIKWNGFTYTKMGSKHKGELHKRLTDTIMIRRLKKDVMKDLPAKTRTVVPLEIDNRELYEEAERDFIGWLEGIDPERAERASKAEALTQIGGLKKIIIKGKIKQCVSWIEDFLESDEKLVVYALHRVVINHLMKKFPGIAVKVDGTVTGKKRQDAIDTFQTDPKIRLFVGQLKAMEGIDLTAASNCCTIEFAWSPTTHDQGDDRLHRIGQKYSVNANYLVAENTIEEDIIGLLDEKREVLEKILDGTDVEDESLLTKLLNKYREGGETVSTNRTDS